jgi:hypothetical protein
MIIIVNIIITIATIAITALATPPATTSSCSGSTPWTYASR